MTERPPQPPEMVLIQRKREAARLSMARAAKASGHSETWWRWKEAGSRSTSIGYAPERASDRGLAAMALAVGVSPGELREVRRDGAAAELEKLAAEREAQAAADEADAMHAVDAMTRKLSPSQRGALTERITEALRDIRSDRD
jgi:hypothetical protein